MTNASKGNRIATLKRYQLYVEEYLKHKKPENSVLGVYRVYIYPKYCISRGTFYKALGTNFKQEFEKLNKI